MRSERVFLQSLEDSDAEPFTKAVNGGLTTEHLFTGSVPMRTKDYAEKWRAERAAGDILFGIWTKEKFIGTCGLHSHRDIYKSWEARFLIFDPGAVGQGLGKDCVRLLTDYAFRRLNAHRVWLGVSEANKRAVKCYLDCGYVVEGRLRDDIYYEGKYHAVLRMSVLEDEWKSGSLDPVPLLTAAAGS